VVDRCAFFEVPTRPFSSSSEQDPDLRQTAAYERSEYRTAVTIEPAATGPRLCNVPRVFLEREIWFSDPRVHHTPLFIGCVTVMTLSSCALLRLGGCATRGQQDGRSWHYTMTGVQKRTKKNSAAGQQKTESATDRLSNGCGEG
jgi:hypothetical protein